MNDLFIGIQRLRGLERGSDDYIRVYTREANPGCAIHTLQVQIPA